MMKDMLCEAPRRHGDAKKNVIHIRMLQAEANLILIHSRGTCPGQISLYRFWKI
jgi:hypothetical protein